MGAPRRLTAPALRPRRRARPARPRLPRAVRRHPGDHRATLIVVEELARADAGGLIAGLLSHGIGAPPILHFGSDALKDRVLPPILAGHKISALAVTEPGGGSDVANLRTTARRDGDHYIVDGSKVFITSGVQADYITTAVRTGGPGLGGISLLLIEADAPASPAPHGKNGLALLRHRRPVF